jgi:mono/diheme cytochrome c family protein
MLLTVLGAVSCAAGRAEQKPDHAMMDHGMHGAPPEAGHAGQETGPAAMDGSWSYLSRDNPKPFKEKRWEMVPVPGYDFLYVNTQKLSPDLVCEALRDNPRTMVDRAARKACGMPETPPDAMPGRAKAVGEPVKKEPVEHGHHPGMRMSHEDPGGMQEHWLAPEEAAARKSPVPADPASIERGSILYQTHCAVCHGPQGSGDGPGGVAIDPAPTDLAEMAGRHPDGDLAWKIENGRGAMPTWKGILSEDQIWNIVVFLKRLSKDHGKHTSGSHGPGHAP